MVKYSKLLWKQENIEALAQAQFTKQTSALVISLEKPSVRNCRKAILICSLFRYVVFWSGKDHNDTLKLMLWRYHTKHSQNGRGSRDIWSSFLCSERVCFELIMRESKYYQRKILKQVSQFFINKLRGFILEIKVFANIFKLIRRKRRRVFLSLTSFYTTRKQVSGICKESQSQISQPEMICNIHLESKVLEVGNMKVLTSHLLLRKWHGLESRMW